MTKEEKELVITILVYVLRKEKPIIITREQRRMLEKIINELSKED